MKKVINKIIKKMLYISLVIILLIGIHDRTGTAQERQTEYIIGAGDLLAIKFWQKPEYNTDTRVNAAGDIQLPLIGTIKTAGSTLNQLKDNIEARISLLDINITQVSVIILEYGSKSIYVTGAVGNPGKLNFEVIPNLWQIILEAGGPLPTAQLKEVTVVRGDGKEAGKILHVNLAEALEQGTLSSLPAIYPGDTIHIVEAATTGATAVTASPLEQRDVVYVFGDVRNPGAFNIDRNMNALDALILAGGPMDTANLRKIRLVYREGGNSGVAIVDIQEYLQGSVPIPLSLHSGDVVYVPKKQAFSPWVEEIIRTLIYTTASYLIFMAAN